MEKFTVLVTADVLRLDRPTPKSRQAIRDFLQDLELDPYRLGDYQESDAIGRSVQIKLVGNYALTYWVDHAVKEVKVTKIEKAD